MPKVTATRKDQVVPMAKKYYTASLEHILEELQRIDLLIRLQVERARRIQGIDSEFRGLHISEQDVDGLLAKPVGLPRWADDNARGIDANCDSVVKKLADEISQRKAQSIAQGITLRLDQLAQLFDLTDFDIDALLICLAPELDLRYERLFAYLQDDVTKKHPSVELVLDLLYLSLEGKIEARKRFTNEFPLLKYQLVNLLADPAQIRPSLLSKYLKIDERLVNYLLGPDEMDGQLAFFARAVDPRVRMQDLHLPEDIRDRLTSIASYHDSRKCGLVFYFHGPYGVGRQTTAEALCLQLGLKLLVVDVEKLIGEMEGANFETLVRRTLRETRLQDAALYLDSFGTLLEDSKENLRTLLLRELEQYRGLVFLAADSAWEPKDILRVPPFVRVNFQIPSSAERTRLWASALNDDTPCEAGLDLDGVAGRFRFTAGQIKDAAITARNLARWRDPTDWRVTLPDLHGACRRQSNQKLATLARKVTPHYTWDDIVLPRDQLQQLREVYNTVKHRSLVYDRWGFDQKLSLGKGLNVLFAGPSGTGKTMAADIIANGLGLDMYKIDLSGVVSKYIGETEKNLARIFSEAETSNAILFFDEADALFGKRSEVRDAHDRHANIEVSYLLQRMEEYDGIVILATNFRKNMDNAFVRRLHFSIEFPFPCAKDRCRIWERMWPEATPRSEDMDLELMAQRFEIAGGNIRNIALASAFLAADDGGEINMTHLIQATRREYQKMGKVIVGGEFGHRPKTMHDEANKLQ